VDTKKVKNIIIFGGVLYGKEALTIYERVWNWSSPEGYPNKCETAFSKNYKII